MAYVEDIAASAAASWADSFSSPTQITFGSKVYNFGGANSTSFDAAQKQDTDTSAASDAVASTSKADNGSVAESSASLSKLAAQTGIPEWAIYAALAAAVLALATGGIALIRSGRK